MKTTQDKPWILAQNKALAHGIASLSQEELLSVLGAPQRQAWPEQLTDLSHESLRALKQSEIGEFSSQYQVGIGLACKLAAGLELGTRYWSQAPVFGIALNNPETVRSWLRTELRDRSQEVFCCLFLDSRHRLIRFEELFKGGLDSAEVHPRIVLQQCLRHRAAAVLLAHNHPSGHPEPSAADHALTQRLKQALALIDVRVLDHFIVAGNRITSFAEQGWL